MIIDQLFSLTEIRFKFLWFDRLRVISILEKIYQVTLLKIVFVAARVVRVPRRLH